MRLELPAKYWSLPAGDNYKLRFKKALQNKEYILTKKMDGALYRYSKSDSDAILQSRTVSAKTKVLVEKQDVVPAIMAALDKLPANTMLMGEICYEDQSKTSKEVISIMGCLPKKAIERQAATPVVFYVFDVLMYDGKEMYNQTYEKRIELLNKISATDFGQLVKFAKPIYDNIEEQLAEWLAEGFEGGMLMHKREKYVFNKRPAWASIKVKQSLADTLDLVIMDFTKPVEDYTGKYPQGWTFWKNQKTGELVEGNYYKNGGFKPISENFFANKIGGFVLGAYYNGQLKPVCKVANLTDELRDLATVNGEDYIGRVVRVQAMSVDNENRSLRHPKLIDFHPDKNAVECLYEEIFG